MRRLFFGLFLIAMAAGFGAAVIGVFKRRPDVTWRQIAFAGSYLVSTPERFVQKQWIGVVRWLGLVSALLFLAAVVSLMWSGFREGSA